MNSGNVFCRLCAELKPINKQVNLQCDSKKYNEIIGKLRRLNTPIELIDTKLPSTVCLECICSLNRCFDFVVSIECAQTIINDVFYLQNVKQEAHSECSEEDTSMAIAEVDIHIKTEADNVVIDRKRVKTPNKVRKSGSLDSMPLSQLKQTWENYSWLCTYCETLFPTIDELFLHSIDVHNSCNPYRCTDCRVRKESLAKFIIHVQKHSQHLKYSCFKCLKPFKTKHLARKHSKTHFNTDLNCPGCCAAFKTKEELEQHKETYFKVKYPRVLPHPSEEDLTCSECSKTFKNRSNLNIHQLTHTERKREHICEICGKCFFQKHNLACHMLMHSDDRPHKCEICKLGFKTGTRLKHHIGIHNNDKPFSCDQCGRCFRLLKQLKNHSIIHTDSLPYECPHCEKRFRFKSILNNHERLHTGVKPYSCETCQRDFANWSNYNKHMKRKHNHDTAKKKHTPDGVYPIDPTTGEVIFQPETKQVLEWKKKIMLGRRGGSKKTDQTSSQSVVKKEKDAENSI